jgi:hypothetical protein
VDVSVWAIAAIFGYFKSCISALAVRPLSGKVKEQVFACHSIVKIIKYK